MPIVSIRRDYGTGPTTIRITATDDFPTITAPGYITSQSEIINKLNKGPFPIRHKGLVAITYDDGESRLKYDATTDTLTTDGSDIITPTGVNYIAHFANEDGTLTSASANVLNDGNIEALSIANQSALIVNAFGAGKGRVRIESEPHTANYDVRIIIAEQDQGTAFTIPDPAAGTARFLLNRGPDNEISFQQFIGIENIISTTGPSFAPSRISEGNYIFNLVSGVGTSTIGFNLTTFLRTAANKGLKLTAVKLVFRINGSASLSSHQVKLFRVSYENNTAPLVETIFTDTHSVAVQSLPYVESTAITSPAFNNLSNSNYIYEIATGIVSGVSYGVYGVILEYDATIA